MQENAWHRTNRANACVGSRGLSRDWRAGAGEGIHSYLESKDIAADGYVANALVDMYAKCGRLELARQVFESMSIRDVTCLNAMIVGLSVHAYTREALELFDSMKVKPDHVTFIKDMPVKSNSVLWKRVLAACQVHRHINLANRVFHELHQLMPDDDGGVIVISNVYAEAKGWDDVEHLRMKVVGCSALKHAAHSQVDVR